ncbi:MAG: DUF624 domain-containing protein [Eubacteriales bacterium]|nr:DUF624 domain-containing protein [Eubacteriales bacterium]
MDEIFNPDGKFFRFMEKFLELVKLNALWVIFSLPVITAGASTFAMFTVAGQIADGEEGYIWKSFWKAFRGNWKKSSLLWLVTGGIGMGLLLDYRFWSVLDSPVSGMMKGFTIALIIVYLTGAIYVFPLAARMDCSVKIILQNSWFLGVKYLPRTLLMLVWIALEAFAVRLWALALLMGMLLGVSGMAWLIEIHMKKIFGKEHIIETEEQGALS